MYLPNPYCSQLTNLPTLTHTGFPRPSNGYINYYTTKMSFHKADADAAKYWTFLTVINFHVQYLDRSKNQFFTNRQ